MGYPDVIWGHHVGIDTVNWNRYREVDTVKSILWSRYCTHTLWGGNFWWLWRRCGDGVVYVWSVRGLGYPVTGLSCGLGYPTGDGITSLIGKIGSSGGWRRLVMVTTWGIHVNLLEHEWTWIFPHVSVDGVLWNLLTNLRRKLLKMKQIDKTRFSEIWRRVDF